MLRELIDGLQVTLAGGSDGETRARPLGCRSCPTPASCATWSSGRAAGELLRLTLGEDRWQLVERMQAAMSLIEGHAEHTMDAVGAEVLPSLPRLRAAMNRRRETAGCPGGCSSACWGSS